MLPWCDLIMRLLVNILPATMRRFSTVVHYITDTEGHAASFYDSIQRSGVVQLERNKRLVFKKTAATPFFIFGGDLTDRGVGDLELLEMMLDFKRRHSEQVLLLVGNREASKTRIYTETDPKYIRERLLQGGVPHWLEARPHKRPLDYVKNDMLVRGQSFEQPNRIDDYVRKLSTEECQLLYLKWMFEQNMGCPHTLTYYAQQLAQVQQRSVRDVSEHEVVQYVIKQASPTGLMGEYLQQTQIAAILPDTGILAVHGGLTSANIGRLPVMQKTDPMIRDARSWIEQFNAWYRLQVMQWAKSKPNQSPLQLQPARSTLDSFAVRIPADYMSIVTASILDGQRQFQAIPTEVSDYLQENGIYLVLTGHQPCGDHPALLRSSDDRLLYIMGDTGYANSQANEIHNTRGKTSYALQIYADIHTAHVDINAHLLTGTQVNTYLSIKRGQIATDSYVGKLLPGNELVQCKLPDGNYRTIHQNRFTVQYAIRTASEIEMLLASAQLPRVMELA